MRRRRLLGAGVSALALPRAAAAQLRDLTVVARGGAEQEAMREALFRPWMAARGARLLEETWHGGLAELRGRLAAGAATWDVVLVEAEELAIGCREGLFEPLDPEALGGAAHYIEGALDPCGVGAFLHAFVLAWDRARGLPAPRGWADLFDPGRIPGRRALRRSPRTTLEIALLAEEVPPAALYDELATEAGLARAFRRLEGLREHILWWERGAQPAQWLASGEAVLAVASSGRIAAANLADGLDLGLLWRQNLAAMESWAVAKGSPNREAALDFLRSAGRPEAQARLAALIPHAPTAREAAALIPREVLPRLPTAPAHAQSAIALDRRFWQAHAEPLAARFQAWLAG